MRSSGPPSTDGGRALVTGASGFIGGHLLERLRATTGELHAVARAEIADPDDGVGWWRADLRDADAVMRAFARVRPDVVFHLAGDTRAARELDLVLPTFEANVVATVNVLHAAAAAGCGRVVLSGSLEEPAETPAATPSSPYAASKWTSGLYARTFQRLYGLSVVTLRLFMVYGPRQRDPQKLIPYTILSLLRGKAPELTSGVREVDWVYVEDVADAYVAAASAPDVGGLAIDVGTGRLHSVREVVERLTRLVAPDIEPRFGALAERVDEQIRAADVETAAARLGWRAATDLDEGLRRTVEWFRERA